MCFVLSKMQFILNFYIIYFSLYGFLIFTHILINYFYSLHDNWIYIYWKTRERSSYSWISKRKKERKNKIPLFPEQKHNSLKINRLPRQQENSWNSPISRCSFQIDRHSRHAARRNYLRLHLSCRVGFRRVGPPSQRKLHHSTSFVRGWIKSESENVYTWSCIWKLGRQVILVCGKASRKKFFLSFKLCSRFGIVFWKTFEWSTGIG